MSPMKAIWRRMLGILSARKPMSAKIAPDCTESTDRVGYVDGLNAHANIIGIGECGFQ